MILTESQLDQDRLNPYTDKLLEKGSAMITARAFYIFGYASDDVNELFEEYQKAEKELEEAKEQYYNWEKSHNN